MVQMTQGQKIVAFTLIPAAMFICFSDYLWNAPKLVELSPGAETAADFLAAAIAFSATIFVMLSKGSYFVKFCSFMIVILSMVISILSGMGTTANAHNNLNNDYARRNEIQKILNTELTSTAIRECERGSRTCDSAEARAYKKELQKELRTLPLYGKIDEDKDMEVKAGEITKLIALAILPLMAFICALILDRWSVMDAILGELPETGTNKGSEDENNGSHGSLTRNHDEKSGNHGKKKTELEAGVSTQKRPRVYIPNEEERKIFEIEYKKRKANGESVSGQNLGVATTIGKAKALWWLRNCKTDVILLEDKRKGERA